MVVTADAARPSSSCLADRDAHAFDSVMEAFRMPKETDEEKAARSAAIQAGYLAAASVPQEVARKAVDLMELAEDATAMGNPQAASDGLSAAASLYVGRPLRHRERGDQRGVIEGRRRPDRRCSTNSSRSRPVPTSSLEEAQTAFQLRLAS